MAANMNLISALKPINVWRQHSMLEQQLIKEMQYAWTAAIHGNTVRLDRTYSRKYSTPAQQLFEENTVSYLFMT